MKTGTTLISQREIAFSVNHSNDLTAFNNHSHRDAWRNYCRMHSACCVHACTFAPQPCGPLRARALSCVLATKREAILRRSWNLRLKQIECYQAFRADDKEYRTDAEAFETPGGDGIGKSSLAVSRALTPSHIRSTLSYIAPLTIIGWQQTCYYTPSKNLRELSLVPCRRTRGTRVHSRQDVFVTQVISYRNKTTYYNKTK